MKDYREKTEKAAWASHRYQGIAPPHAVLTWRLLLQHPPQRRPHSVDRKKLASIDPSADVAVPPYRVMLRVCICAASCSKPADWRAPEWLAAARSNRSVPPYGGVGVPCLWAHTRTPQQPHQVGEKRLCCLSHCCTSIATGNTRTSLLTDIS